MGMFHHDPFGQGREEYWFDRARERHRRGHNATQLTAMDALWDIAILVVKVVTLPVWLSISLWRKLRKRRQRPN